MRVLKFGGAALRDAASIRRAAAIAAAPGPRIVVVSAIEGVTDQLLAAQTDACRAEGNVPAAIAALRSRHLELLADVGGKQVETAAALTAILQRLERLLYGIAYTQEVTPRLHDLVLSFGERLAAPVVAAALRSAGVAAIDLDAECAGIRSLGPFGNAVPDLAALRREAAPRLHSEVSAGRVPVVTGYYGVDPDGHSTLFGRGGSDYVAALVAYAVRAERLELWKGVAGFLTADPRAVAEARLIPELGYDEAAELANFGAKVLHPRTVEPAEAAGIPIHIRSVAQPDARGTVISEKAPTNKAGVRSVATTSNLAILRLNGPGMAYTPGVAKRVFGPLADAGVNVINMATSQASFALLIDERDLPRAQTALQPLLGSVVQSLDARPGRGLVCVVGKSLGETPGSAAGILHAVGAAGVNVDMISLGASDIAIDFIVKQEDAARAVRAVHDAYLRGGAS